MEERINKLRKGNCGMRGWMDDNWKERKRTVYGLFDIDKIKESVLKNEEQHAAALAFCAQSLL